MPAPERMGTMNDTAARLMTVAEMVAISDEADAIQSEQDPCLDAGPVRVSTHLPRCPCGMRPTLINTQAIGDDGLITFDRCGHVFTLTLVVAEKANEIRAARA
jgi:hypothetical protein